MPNDRGYAGGSPDGPYGQGWPAAYSTGYRPAAARRATTARTVLRSWVVIALAIIGFSIAALMLAAYYGAAFGVMTSLLAVLCAAIPLGIVVPTFLWLDRFEAEPTRLLVVAFLWGALVASMLAAVFNTGALLLFQSWAQGDGALAAAAVFVAPPVEEALKGLIVLLIWWFRRREFDGIIDGMVYAGITAAGFAFTENIQYLATAFTEGGTAGLAGVFVARAVMSPFAHPIFTVMTGIGIGIAATTRSPLVRVVAPVCGYLLAVCTHALWNLAALTGGQGLPAVYVLFELPVFLAFVCLILWARRREGRLIGRYLRPYADAGWLSPAEVGMLSSMAMRREARMWARANGGRRGLANMRAFQDSASELALLRQRMYHSSADAAALQSERVLLDTLVASRREFVGSAMV
jgi:protease PrsW